MFAGNGAKRHGYEHVARKTNMINFPAFILNCDTDRSQNQVCATGLLKSYLLVNSLDNLPIEHSQ